MNYIQEVDLILIPVLIAIGYALAVAKFINDKYIPFILIVVGAILGNLVSRTMNGALEGVICAGIALGIHHSGRFNRK